VWGATWRGVVTGLVAVGADLVTRFFDWHFLENWTLLALALLASWMTLAAVRRVAQGSDEGFPAKTAAVVLIGFVLHIFVAAITSTVLLTTAEWAREQLRASPAAMQATFEVEPYTPPQPLIARTSGSRLRETPFARPDVRILALTTSEQPLNVVGRSQQADGVWYQVILSDGPRAYIRGDQLTPAPPRPLPTAEPKPALPDASAPAGAATNEPLPSPAPRPTAPTNGRPTLPRGYTEAAIGNTLTLTGADGTVVAIYFRSDGSYVRQAGGSSVNGRWRRSDSRICTQHSGAAETCVDDSVPRNVGDTWTVRTNQGLIRYSILAGQVSTPASERPRLIDPPWTSRPTPRDLAEYFPERAAENNITGRVVLDCIVDAAGQLLCRVLSEDPRGYGFADASLRAARDFRVELRTPDGTPTEGASIRLPIQWRLERPRR